MSAETLAARVDAAADTIIKSQEPGSPKRDRLITLVTNLHHAARVFGVDTGAWRGCLLDLVREAWGDPAAGVRFRRGLCPFWLAVGWVTGDDCVCEFGIGASEAEALVAAVEAAPP